MAWLLERTAVTTAQRDGVGVAGHEIKTGARIALIESGDDRGQWADLQWAIENGWVVREGAVKRMGAYDLIAAPSSLANSRDCCWMVRERSTGHLLHQRYAGQWRPERFGQHISLTERYIADLLQASHWAFREVA